MSLLDELSGGKDFDASYDTTLSLFNGADALAGFNSATFDNNFLVTEFIRYGVEFPPIRKLMLCVRSQTANDEQKP